MWFTKTPEMVDEHDALPGRTSAMAVGAPHHVLGVALDAPLDDALRVIDVAMGCFWGAERLFWELPGVVVTCVGYEGGFTPNPTYEEVCSGRTGHAEVVRVVFDPDAVSLETILTTFFEGHDPTQGFRQGNDVGTQYRSAIYAHSTTDEAAARAVAAAFQERLAAAGFGPITTEIAPAGAFYLAEEYHQQYLSKNPGGYCGLGGTGVSCPVGPFAAR
jgi:peptide-methionine (S)-S-oxide reductase